MHAIAGQNSAMQLFFLWSHGVLCFFVAMFSRDTVPYVCIIYVHILLNFA